MKLTIEATDPIEIAHLAGFLAGIKNSPDLATFATATKVSEPSVEVTVRPTEEVSVVRPTVEAEVNTDQGARKRGRPKKSTEMSTIPVTSDGSADYAVESLVPVADEFAPVEPEVPCVAPTETFPTLEETRKALIDLSDKKGVAVAGQLCEQYAGTRSAKDIPENKRAELIAKAEELRVA